jgi:hypothetical protein
LHNNFQKEKEREKKGDQVYPFRFQGHPTVLIGPKKKITEKNHNIMKLRNNPQAKNWSSIIGGPNFWSAGRVKPCLLNTKIFFKILAFTPCVKALGLI